jgi:hypothetical protein
MKKKHFYCSRIIIFSFCTGCLISKSTVKDKTGIDLNNPQATKGSTTATTGTNNHNNSHLSSTKLSESWESYFDQISSGLKEALSIGVTDGVKKLALTDGFEK